MEKELCECDDAGIVYKSKGIEYCFNCDMPTKDWFENHKDKYSEWIKQAELPPLTNTQRKFAEWLLLEENSKQISQIGDLETIFKSVRKYLKS